MKVHVENRWQQDALAIWIRDDLPGSKPRILRVVSPLSDGDFAVQWEEFDPQVYDPHLQPTLVLPRPVVEELVRALSDHEPPSAALAAHLADAVTVRDRLLTLVEQN